MCDCVMCVLRHMRSFVSSSHHVHSSFNHAVWHISHDFERFSPSAVAGRAEHRDGRARSDEAIFDECPFEIPKCDGIACAIKWTSSA